MTLMVIMLVWALILATEAYRRTAPAPRGTVAIVVSVVLISWLILDALGGAVRIG
jgi:hypothetical protein